MSPTEMRDRAVKMARNGTGDAETAAAAIPEPWFRAQALAAVARWSSGPRAPALAAKALRAAGQCKDAYQTSAVCAWPIRALIEQGHADEARKCLAEARRMAHRATPTGSCVEALMLLLQAAWPLGPSIRRALVQDLARLEHGDAHWRTQRALVHAVAMIADEDRTFADEVAQAIRDDKCRRRAHRALLQEPPQPRAFY